MISVTLYVNKFYLCKFSLYIKPCILFVSLVERKQTSFQYSMKYLIALSLLAVASCQWECDECLNCCPGGCCNYIDWLCCPNQMWCAPTLDDCPPVTEKDQLTNMAALKQKQCDGDGIACPGGCCPYLG